MARCASCTREIPQDSPLCPYCGVAVTVAPGEPTVTAPTKPARAPPQPDQPGSSSDSIDQARFTSGTMLAERYRIVGLLGKGGMGEVYRADDLKLRQPVALKLLPEALSNEPRRLERFHHEVRVARQVSHPNVCREPYVRRRWPDVLISSNRVLTGRLRDPLVGRDILVGAAIGAMLVVLSRVCYLAPVWLESPPMPPTRTGLSTLVGGVPAAARLFTVGFAVEPIGVLFLLLLLRSVLRKQWLAVGVLFLICTSFTAFEGLSTTVGPGKVVSLLFGGVKLAILLVVLLRLGLVAAVAMCLFDDCLGWGFPITLDTSAWYMGTSTMALLFLTAIALYALSVSLAGRSLLRDELLEA